MGPKARMPTPRLHLGATAWRAYTVNEMYDILLFTLAPNNEWGDVEASRAAIRDQGARIFRCGQQLLNNHARDHKTL